MLKRLIPLAIIAVGVVGFMILKATRPEPAEVAATERSWRVEIQRVEPASRAPVLSLYGEVVAPDQQTITATLAGRVAQRPVSEGMVVQQGDLLLALDEADTRPALAQARAQVADLEAQTRSEQVRYSNDQVSLKSERAILANARRQFERIESLVERNLASRENLEVATDALVRAELTISARTRAIQEHPARLQSTEARLAQAMATLASTERDIERATVLAPFDGVVTGIQVAVGDQVSRNEPLFSVYPNHGMEVRARVPQAFQAELMAAVEKGDVLTAESAQGHEFVLERFAGLSDPAGTEVVLALQGEPGVLRPGALLALSLNRPARAQAVAVPFTALYGADSVYLMTGQGRMKRVEVERIGEAQSDNGERWLLIAGEQLTPGAPVIITHLPNAVTGLKVELAVAAGDPSL
ncbi:efflux RND transporter periplasmic adaptor subunit [Marinobacter sp.]|uniref:efflux RND transporter periplasmic adaptor subunit n=1 Tax=Marinobacter sp. TaxID=50741 RepID=UPI002B26B2C6|nr:HlyD family efflux transporter periplasmic adaptor subunit [Marinobacter sp.]